MVILRWYSGDLIIENATPEIKSLLSYIHKSLQKEEGGWRQVTVKTKRELWTAVPDEPQLIVTYQGLIDRVVAYCRKQGIEHRVEDHREPFPNPDLTLAKGFRAGQFGVFVQFLKANRSGLLKAPTRYGKSTQLQNLCRVFPDVPTVLTAPGADLLGQMVSELEVALPRREIRGIFTGSRGKKQSKDITVVSMDSLHKINPDDIRLVLVDEPHALAAASRIGPFGIFKKARILGVGATLEGRFDGADAVITGLIGPVLVEKKFQDAVRDGAICNIKVFVVRMPFEPFRCFDRQHAYNNLVYKNLEFMHLVRRLEREVIPAGWQTLVFIDKITQAEELQEFVSDSTLAIASLMNDKERKDCFARMQAGDIKRCICTSIYSQGVTFPDLRVIINAAGGGGSITGTQKPGRLAQIRPGKKQGYMIDFLFHPRQMAGEPVGGDAKGETWKMVVRDSFARLKKYKENGYAIQIVDRVEDIVLE